MKVCVTTGIAVLQLAGMFVDQVRLRSALDLVLSLLTMNDHHLKPFGFGCHRLPAEVRWHR